MSSRFLAFLQSECTAINAFVEEIPEFDTSFEETITINMGTYLRQYPRLNGYFDEEQATCNPQLSGGNEGEEDSPEPNNPQMSRVLDYANHQIKKRKIDESTSSWSLYLRLAVLDHLSAMEIGITFLLDVVEKYNFDLEVEELVEIVRAFDILGAEKRLVEYEALLYIAWVDSELDETEWSKRCGERIPVSFFNHVKKYKHSSRKSKIIGSVGSQRLIEYFLAISPEKDYFFSSSMDSSLLAAGAIFQQLCEQGQLSVAQWLYSSGDIDIHAEDDNAFRGACRAGQLQIAQWLYNLGNIDIHASDEEAFRLACIHGHLSIAQWLYNFGNVNIHVENDDIFRNTCRFGHLPIAKWLFSLGDIDIHAAQDEAFLGACWEGYQSTAEWLYSFGGISVEEVTEAFKEACRLGHLSTAQWLYSLGGVDICAGSYYAFYEACYNYQLSVAQWVHSLGGGDIGTENYNALFRLICKRGYLSIAQWLYSLGDIDIHANYDAAFRGACLKGHLAIAQWLYSLGVISKNLVRSSWVLIITDKQVMTWLKSLITDS
jgi:uncharacterized protein